MTATMLRREPLRFAADEARLSELISFRDLGDAAENRLGYCFLKNHLRTQEEEIRKALSLKKVLAEFDIEPFRAADVAQYKTKAVRRASSMWKNTIVFFHPLIAGSATVLLLVSLLTSGVMWLFGDIPHGIIVIRNGSFLTLLGCFLLAFPTGWVWIRSARWVTVPIAEYRRPIPEFVLQTAVDVQAKYPGATFLVEELVIEERVLDPFLIVQDPSGKAYYLEVWNEPAFGGKREG